MQPFQKFAQMIYFDDQYFLFNLVLLTKIISSIILLPYFHERCDLFGGVIDKMVITNISMIDNISYKY